MRWQGRRDDPIWQAAIQSVLSKFCRLDDEAVRNSPPGAVNQSVIHDEYDWAVLQTTRLRSVIALGYKRGYDKKVNPFEDSWHRDQDPNPWTTFCFTHGNEIDHPTRKAAESWIAWSHFWCDECDEVKEAKEA